MIPDEYEVYLDDACGTFEIDTKDRAAMFLAQLDYESAGFTKLEEDLRYSAGRLLQVFPKYFTPAEAEELQFNPEAIANKVYGDRLGNTEPGDGYKFRGRGFIQLTGRGNYRKAGKALGVDLEANPDLAADAQIAALIAAWYWRENGCNELADSGNFAQITRAISGSTRTLPERFERLHKYRRWLS